MTLFLLLGCETGVNYKENPSEPLKSGIIDRSDGGSKYHSNVNQKSYKTSSNKIFSKSAQPGYYLQMAFFKKNRPSKEFLKPLKDSKFSYIVLNKFSTDYVLIGPYLSYNLAKSKMSTVKNSLGKNTFVVQVLRP